MIRRKIGTTLASFGAAMLIFGMSALPAQGAAPANVLLQPSPRPAIDPLKHRGGATEMGHITGTVIDQRTGAPAPGITVSVGGDLVTTDANGNYDHWLPVGDYQVALQLAGDQTAGEASAVMVSVLPAVPTVQHLGFRSAAPAPAQPAAAPAVEPTAAQAAAPAIVPTAVPTAVPAAPKPATPAIKADVGAPKRMPRTAAENNAAWLWLAFGMLLLLAGGLVGFGPVLNGRSAAALIRRHAANSQLLQALLSQPARDEFLAALFDAHDRGRK